jgi:hypothetical protein
MASFHIAAALSQFIYLKNLINDITISMLDIQGEWVIRLIVLMGEYKVRPYIYFIL